MDTLLFQTSLIAAFIAGMVALFAPCCITFLLPAYLGSVFKEREKVLFMTLVFGLGIFVVLLPAVLGVSLISQLLFRYHSEVYLTAGAVMLFIAVVSFLGIKLPMPKISQKAEGKTDILSIFTLGIFSGITSACCAPVLIGILALTFLSSSFFGALLLGAVYVLGMVVPLFIISLFLSGKMPNFTWLRKSYGSLKLLGKEYPIILNNIIAGVIFFITGTLTVLLTLSGKLSMQSMSNMTNTVQGIGGWVNAVLGGSLFVNILFLGVIIAFFYVISKKI